MARRRARASEEGKFFILVLTSLAAIGAIVAQLAVVKDLSGTIKGLHIVLAAATIVSVCFYIHLTYALHYAQEYFTGPGSWRPGAADWFFLEPKTPAILTFYIFPM